MTVATRPPPEGVGSDRPSRPPPTRPKPTQAQRACRRMLREWRRLRRGIAPEAPRRRPVPPPGSGPEPALPAIAPSPDVEDRRKVADRHSKYRGVYWDRNQQTWRARVYHKPPGAVSGEALDAGRSKDEEIAARKHDEMAYHLMGESAVLNFPRGTDP